MMDLSRLRYLAGRYFDHLENAKIYVPPELAGYNPQAAFTEEFVAYASVPSKLFGKTEFFEIVRLIESAATNLQDQNYAYYIYRVLSARFANLLNNKLQNKINIVSIRGNCLPRLLFSKWGIRKTRPLGAKSLPFDLVWCEPQGVAEILASDFVGMVDPAFLSSATNADVRTDWKWFVGNVPVAVNDKFSICYNHEAGESWLDNGYSNLIDRYKNRIRRFREITESQLPTVALMNYQRPFSKLEYDQLQKGIEKLSQTSKGDIHVACVVSAGERNHYNREQTIDINHKLRLTISYNLQPPDPYLFYMPSSYASAAGLAWETEFLRILALVIEKEAGSVISTGLN